MRAFLVCVNVVHAAVLEPPPAPCPVVQFRLRRVTGGRSMVRSSGSPSAATDASEASTDGDASSEPQRFAAQAPDQMNLSEGEGGRLFLAWRGLPVLQTK